MQNNQTDIVNIWATNLFKRDELIEEIYALDDDIRWAKLSILDMTLRFFFDRNEDGAELLQEIQEKCNLILLYMAISNEIDEEIYEIEHDIQYIEQNYCVTCLSEAYYQTGLFSLSNQYLDNGNIENDIAEIDPYTIDDNLALSAALKS
jgi:hypothetical protein